jgi:hypothetical protein
VDDCLRALFVSFWQWKEWRFVLLLLINFPNVYTKKTDYPKKIGIYILLILYFADLNSTRGSDVGFYNCIPNVFDLCNENAYLQCNKFVVLEFFLSQCRHGRECQQFLAPCHMHRLERQAQEWVHHCLHCTAMSSTCHCENFHSVFVWFINYGAIWVCGWQKILGW